MPQLSERVDLFGTCITRLSSIKTAEVNGINLAQGFPEQDPPAAVVEAFQRALREGRHQYADMRGLAELRAALSKRRAHDDPGYVYDPETEITVTCGSTEAMAAALHAVAGPGDEVLIQEPTYENYPPQVILTGAHPRFYRLTRPGDRLDVEELIKVCGSRTKAIIINTPNNPTGRVFSAEELSGLSQLCLERDLYVIADEVYEYLVWEGGVHRSPAAAEGLRSRTIVVSSFSKSYAATGWRLGWAFAPAPITAALRRVHDFLTGCAPTAAQHAAVVALELGDQFYADQRAEYERRRLLLAEYVSRAGLEFKMPQGAYYLFADVRSLGYVDSEQFGDDLLKEAGVGIVPWRAFYRNPDADDRARARFNFAKSPAVLHRAGVAIVEFARRHPSDRQLPTFGIGQHP